MSGVAVPNAGPVDEPRCVNGDLSRLEDAALLGADERPDAAFAVFYRRHVDVVLRFCSRRRLSAAEAADLTAETFAAALLARRRYRPQDGEARSWLLGIAAHKLADRARRWSRDEDARRRLTLERIPLTAADLEDYETLTYGRAERALDALPDGQREAVRARVVEEQDYPVIAQRLGLSESAARRRVSRGIARLHNRLREDQ